MLEIFLCADLSSICLFLVKRLFKNFACLKNCVIYFLIMELLEFFTSALQTSSPSRGLVFLITASFINFNEVQHFLLWIVLLTLYLRNLRLTQGHKDFFLFVFFSINFTVLGFTFKRMIHFELTFIYAMKYGLMFCFFFFCM